MVELSLTDSSLTFATVGDGRSAFRSRVHYTPRQQSGFFGLDRLKVNPKYRLIIFLENPGHSIFPTYSSTSHAKINGKFRHDLC